MTAERSYNFERVAKPYASQAYVRAFSDLNRNVARPGYRDFDVQDEKFYHQATRYDGYWYHSDHLGSSNYITGRRGNVTQHMEYLPYGELLADEHLNSPNFPYKFTPVPTSVGSKELDEETGLYYYGARYYDPKISLWLSVDPLAEKYPGMSPYNYTAGNPVKYIDPTGMEYEPPVKGLAFFQDDTGLYFWNAEKDKYEHYQFFNNGEYYSFVGYYDASEYKYPVGEYSIIYDLSNNAPKDTYDPDKTIWGAAKPILKYISHKAKENGDDKPYTDISNQDKYPGVKILYSKYMNGAITLGNLIITGYKEENILDHEYGHYLDYKFHFNYNKTAYLKSIGIQSLWSATRNDFYSHQLTVSERRANILGAAWFNNQHLVSFYKSFRLYQ